ncbi:MAG: hypothetical protein ABW158_08935, partial [Candidatus Thiodiazotropha sp. 6PDIVS]
GKLLAPSIDKFTEEQAKSAYELITHISTFDGPPNQFQEDVISLFKETMQAHFKSSKGWA